MTKLPSQMSAAEREEAFTRWKKNSGLSSQPPVTVYMLAFFRVLWTPAGNVLSLKHLGLYMESYNTLTRDVGGSEAVLEVLQATASSFDGAVAILRDAVENTDCYAWCREPMEGHWR